MKTNKLWSIFMVLVLVVTTTSLFSSCSKDDEQNDQWVKPTFKTINDIIGKKMIYNEVVDENLNSRYTSSQRNTISFYSGGTYIRTNDAFTHKGKFTFSNGTAHCEETDMSGKPLYIDFQFIDTNKDGYYFKVTETWSNRKDTFYYKFYLSDAD